MEENVWRENYPLTLAGALTHWKAQGMTLDRVRVHLSAKTAGIPGIGFVACTLVRHPWDIVFEEDLPEYEDFMKVRQTKAFRERVRFELRQQARASRTLRRYGYCEADCWAEGERTAAEDLLQGLKLVAREQRERLENQGRQVDLDTWLWGDGVPDYEGELAEVVKRMGAGNHARAGILSQVANRLLDRIRVRQATSEEAALAAELMAGLEGIGGAVGEDRWRTLLLQRAEVCAGGDMQRLERLHDVSSMVARRLVQRGYWDQVVEDSVPVEIQPLHMSAVREALGALIPARSHKSLDQAAQKAKDDFGSLRGGSVLFMDDWRISVRAEDALARGQLQEDALEFFLLVLKHACKVIGLPVTVGSKTVGKEIGRQEDVSKLACVMEKWCKVWDRADVSKKVELLLLVAVDGKSLPQDWMCIVVRSAVPGERLGDAKRLLVKVHDPARRAATARRVARNVDVLVRGIAARADLVEPVVEFCEVPGCRVGSQRVLCAFGLLMGRVGVAAGEPALDVKLESFVPDVGYVLRALFAHFRKELCEHGLRDVKRLLWDAASCRSALQKLGTVPCLTRRAGSVHASDAAARMDVHEGMVVGCAGKHEKQAPAIRIVTWNVAGGHRSAQAPSTYNEKDQRAAVMGEVLRWCRTFACDVIALQECEGGSGYDELLGTHELAGSTEAVDTRGFVQVYVRRGLQYVQVEAGESEPYVAVRVSWGHAGMAQQSLVIAGVHLPVGDCAGKRQRILEQVLARTGVADGRAVLVGDMNTKDDAEVKAMCHRIGLHEARYNGYSWGVKENKFYEDSTYGGVGLRKDRVLFGKKVWAEAHLVGQGKRFFDGREFNLSDHYGVLAYVDVGDFYASLAKQDCVAARVRRGQLVSMRDQAQQRELVEAKAMRQAGCEEQEIARRRAAERNRVGFQQAQRRAARQRRARRVVLKEEAFGAAGLFAENLVSVPAHGGCVPCAPWDVSIVGLDDVPKGSWATTRAVPLRGLRKFVLP